MSKFPKVCADCGTATTGQGLRCHPCGVRNSKWGEKNPQWKGGNGSTIDNVSLHAWVKRRIPRPDNCLKCNERPAIDLANIRDDVNPDTYTRELSNWEWLCRRCHMVRDGRINNLRRGGKVRTLGDCKLCSKPARALDLCESHYRSRRKGSK